MKRSLLVLASILMAWACAVAQPPVSVSGRVLGYLSNRIGDYDGLRIRTTSGEIHVHFPPHTAAKVRQLAIVGKLVEADVDLHPPGPGPVRPSPEGPAPPAETIYRLVQLRNQRSGAVVKLADLPPPPPQSGRLVQAEGPLVGNIHDEAGEVVALLTDKYIIELKPHQSEQISSLLAGVHRLGVVGYERPADGFVNRSGRPLIHPTSLTIRGQTFSL